MAASNFQNKIWTELQAKEMFSSVFTDGWDPNLNDWELQGQVFDVDQFEQDMKKTIDTTTSPVEVNYVLPLKAADVSMKITYKMPAGVSIPEELVANADSSTTDTAIKTVKGFDGQTYVDTPHYLIPEIKGYTASANQIKFDQKAVGSDGTQDVTVTYTKNSTKNSVATPSEQKPVKTLFKVYGKQGLYRYQHVDFKKAERLHHYVKKNRMYAPVFDVVGTATSKAGNPRYLLRDGSYITAKKAFVNKLYWQGKQSTLYVTSPKGTNLYQGMPLTDKVRHLKQGSSVQVVKMVKKGYLTRYQLADGTYITGNKQLVSPTKPKVVTKIKAKANINLYRDVDLQHRIKRIAKGQTVTVKGWDYSFGGITGMTGSKRYKVAGGYITANKALVKILK
ncbi:DUF5776 domain-containing protein [Levilactobacillus humaensis]|uniref:DUF5776 domain-containing protein n=1 Tax=Levilactobacillus humaensis TaxID=2950375 RepID=UPI0021C36C73|nr:DUF5776 domain-containing protein [Levilactobacillus humaensis]